MSTMLPMHVIKESIFPFLSTFDTFRLRGINSNWNHISRTSWLKALKAALYHHVSSLDSIFHIEILKRKWALQYKEVKSFIEDLKSRFTPHMLNYTAQNISLLAHELTKPLIILPLAIIDPTHFYSDKIEMTDEVKMRAFEKYMSDE